MWLENKVFKEDMDYIINVDFIDWSKLNNKTIFITGATGLIGYYLTCALLYRNMVFNSQIKIIVLVRNMAKAKQMFSTQLNYNNINFIEGELENFPDIVENIDYIIHGAGPTDSRYFVEYPVETIKTSVFGTINILELARQKNISGMIYLSSMEVYGVNKKEEKINESHECDLDTTLARNSYPESKRICENLCASFHSEYEVPVNILRLTQTFGPGIDKNDNRVFAQFLKAYFNEQDIILKTPGRTCRSYLYTADAVTAILAVLLCEKYNNVYNCANEDTYCSILDMANLVANEISKSNINVKINLDNTELLKQYMEETYKS